MVSTSKNRTVWKSAAARRLLKMAGNPPAVEEAVRIVANGLLEGVHGPPTDLEAIGPRLNISEFRSEDIPISGELCRDENGFKVVFSSYLSLERRRFTIAHEIGHAVFEATGKNCPRIGTELERLCDMLATEIIMPRDQFLKSLPDEVSVRMVFDLARTFQASISATAIRCAELLGISAFEVENKRVPWSYGVVRKGEIIGLDYDLKCTVEEAIANSGTGSKVIFLHNNVWNGLWNLEWACIGQNGRALFMLQPITTSIVEAKKKFSLL